MKTKLLQFPGQKRKNMFVDNLLLVHEALIVIKHAKNSIFCFDSTQTRIN